MEGSQRSDSPRVVILALKSSMNLPIVNYQV